MSFLGERFKIHKGYKFDRYIFFAYCGVVLIMVGLTVQQYGFKNYVYFTCPADTKGGFCNNPFYKGLPIGSDIAPPQEILSSIDCAAFACEQELIPAGLVLGDAPPTEIIRTPLLILGFLVIAFVVNHFVHNRHFHTEDSWP